MLEIANSPPIPRRTNPADYPVTSSDVTSQLLLSIFKASIVTLVQNSNLRIAPH